jgi:hypothetical protein
MQQEALTQERRYDSISLEGQARRTYADKHAHSFSRSQFLWLTWKFHKTSNCWGLHQLSHIEIDRATALPFTGSDDSAVSSCCLIERVAWDLPSPQHPISQPPALSTAISCLEEASWHPKPRWSHMAEGWNLRVHQADNNKNRYVHWI